MVTLLIAMSLDGYIADGQGGVGWLMGETPGGPDPDSYERFIPGIDRVVMGMRTFRQVREELSPEAWPYAGRTTYVVTRHPRETAEGGEIRFTAESPAALVRRLRQEPGKGIWICGGAEIVRQLMAEDLIDRWQVTVAPTLLGGGIRLFGEMAAQRPLHLVETRQGNGLVELIYERRKAE